MKCSTLTLLQPKPPDNFGDISLRKVIFRKYFKEKCSSEVYTGRNAICRNEIVQFLLRQRNYELLR